ncbi:MAG: rhomboid family intramembrane serine protease, partial [Acidobacteriota bacterium]
MFMPIGDSPNIDETPWLTWCLIAVNVAVHLALLPLAFQPADPADPQTAAYRQAIAVERGIAQPPSISAGDLVRYKWGIKPSDVSLVTAFTAMFLHGGFGHLLGNMLFLWIFGDNVEHRLGRPLFLIAYLGTGLAASLGDVLLRLGSSIPSVGASGAISGLLGLYFVFFPRNRVRVFVFLFPIFLNVVELSARLVLGIYLVVNNLLPLLLTSGGGVSYGAHIGGFVAGWALALRMREARPPRTRMRVDDSGEGEARNPLHERFRQALWTGQLEQATALLFETPRQQSRRLLSAADKVALGDALSNAGHPRAALASYQRALADHPVARERVAAHLGAASLLLYALSTPTAAYQHLYDAMEDEPTAAEEERA